MNSKSQKNGTPQTIRRQPHLGRGPRKRVQLDAKVPPMIREVIEEIAHQENRTVSSVVDEIICDAFGVDYRNGKLRSIERLNKKGKQNVFQMFPQVYYKKA